MIKPEFGTIFVTLFALPKINIQRSSNLPMRGLPEPRTKLDCERVFLDADVGDGEDIAVYWL